MARTTKRERRYGKQLKQLDQYAGHATPVDYKQKAKEVKKHNRRVLSQALRDEVDYL